MTRVLITECDSNSTISLSDIYENNKLKYITKSKSYAIVVLYRAKLLHERIGPEIIQMKYELQ
jgi:hypothetical protein